MLYRFREAQAEELGQSKKPVKRPYMISEVNSLPECDRWRADVIREISRKATKIQDRMFCFFYVCMRCTNPMQTNVAHRTKRTNIAGLNDFQIRDLNDELNKLLREKNRWENRIIELGGPNYRVTIWHLILHIT